VPLHFFFQPQNEEEPPSETDPFQALLLGVLTSKVSVLTKSLAVLEDVLRKSNGAQGLAKALKIITALFAFPMWRKVR
jgi:hypothetical protein